jgi:hypothetical protein
VKLGHDQALASTTSLASAPVELGHDQAGDQAGDQREPALERRAPRLEQTRVEPGELLGPATSEGPASA